MPQKAFEAQQNTILVCFRSNVSLHCRNVVIQNRKARGHSFGIPLFCGKTLLNVIGLASILTMINSLFITDLIYNSMVSNLFYNYLKNYFI